AASGHFAFRLSLGARLRVEWKTQLQQAFPPAFFVQIAYTSQQQVVERDHAGQLIRLRIEYGHAREARLGHAENHDSQRFVRINYNRLAKNVAEGVTGIARLCQAAQLFACDDSADMLVGIHHGIQMLAPLRGLTYERGSQL